MEDKPASPVADASAPLATPTGYPPIAADATDLRQLKKAVEDAAAVSGGLWLSYLFVLFYLAVAAGAVTHVDLFFERPVKLPFLNIELPLFAFFLLAPMLFVLTHVYTMVHFVLLTDKAKRFHLELRRQIRDRPEDDDASTIRNALRRQLPSNIFVQFLAGPDDLRESLFGTLLKAIAWTTLVVAPILLLLLLQIRFLPYHSSQVTWTHRAMILLDLLFIWWLWRLILAGRGIFRRQAPWPAWTSQVTGFALCALVIVFSNVTATFPDEFQEDILPTFRVIKMSRSGTVTKVSLHEWLFDLPVDYHTRRRESYLSNTLVLTGLNVYESLNIDDPKKVEWRTFLFLARNRDLKGATFDLAVIPKIDFSGAQLQGASLDGAQMQGVSLLEARLHGASLENTQLQGASLQAVQLQGVRLGGVKLQGATLEAAKLQGASLDNDDLQGAQLAYAELAGAYLEHVKLQGANLNSARLQGAMLSSAQLQGASFEGASLVATNFWRVALWRAALKPQAAEKSRFSEVSIAPVVDSVAFPTVRWRSQDFDELKRTLSDIVDVENRDAALKRVERLDCQVSDASLASCDPNAPQPPSVTQSFEHAGVTNDAEFEKALANNLQILVCAKDPASIYILRGIIANGRLAATAREAPSFVDFILGKGCPVSAALTDADKAKLLEIKAAARKAWPAARQADCWRSATTATPHSRGITSTFTSTSCSFEPRMMPATGEMSA